MLERPIALVLACLTLAACSTDRQTTTARTATEELLVSTAADRAAEALEQRLPKNGKVFLDTTNFDATDAKYAIGTIADALLRSGNHLVDDKKNADTIIAIRSGALAIDNDDTLIGTPQLNLPVPLAGAATIPKIALYDDEVQKGVAKFAATATDSKTGTLVASTGPQLGVSHVAHHTLLLFFSWDSNDLLPSQEKTGKMVHDSPPPPIDRSEIKSQ